VIAGGGGGGGAIYQVGSDAAKIFQAQIHARQARRSARAIVGALRYLAQLQVVQAKVERNRWETQLNLAYPKSPLYSPLTTVDVVNLPTRLTTKQTSILQRLTSDPDNPRLLRKLTRVENNIERWTRRHPEGVQTLVTTRK